MPLGTAWLGTAWLGTAWLGTAWLGAAAAGLPNRANEQSISFECLWFAGICILQCRKNRLRIVMNILLLTLIAQNINVISSSFT